MPRLVEICPTCGKIKQEAWRTLDFRFLACGHAEPLDAAPTIREEIDFSSRDGSKDAYEFQKDGVRFLLGTNLNALLADAPGVGKTIQSLLAVREAITSIDTFKSDGLRCLIVVPGNVTFNWLRESYSWICDRNNLTDVYPPISGKQPFIPPGFKFYIISRDSVAANLQSLMDLKFNLVIVDECHAFKDISAKRTKALIKLISGLDIRHQHNSDEFRRVETKAGQGIKHRIFLSGTPVLNRADEYFTVLNLLDPVTFPNLARFRSLWLDGPRLKTWRKERFHETTKRYVLRREKTDVLKNLPPFTRNYEWVTITDPEVKNTYNAQLKQFRLEMLDGLAGNQILGWLARMRALTAKAKLEFALEWIENWMEDSNINTMLDPTYPNKLLVGVHHEDVVNTLKYGLSRFGAISLTGKDSAIEKQNIVDKFTNDKECRLLICNMLAGGEGQNIQCAPNILTIERQWNAAKEDQFEARSWRDGQKYPVTNTILMAGGTIDQFMHEKVETKRIDCANTVGYNIEEDKEGLKELVWKILDNPL